MVGRNNLGVKIPIISVGVLAIGLEIVLRYYKEKMKRWGVNNK